MNARQSHTLFSCQLSRLQTLTPLVPQVECGQYPVPGYCGQDKVGRTAHGFRDGQERIAFPLDTLFNLNAIVASALQ